MKFGHVLFPKEKKTLLKECKFFKLLFVVILKECVFLFRGLVGSLDALHFYGHVSFTFWTIFRFYDIFVGFYKEALQQITLMMEALNLQRFLL